MDIISSIYEELSSIIDIKSAHCSSNTKPSWRKSTLSILSFNKMRHLFHKEQ